MGVGVASCVCICVSVYVCCSWWGCMVAVKRSAYIGDACAS